MKERAIGEERDGEIEIRERGTGKVRSDGAAAKGEERGDKERIEGRQGDEMGGGGRERRWGQGEKKG